MLCGLLTVTREFKGLIISNIVAVIITSSISGILIKMFDIQGASIALCLGLLTEMMLLFIYLNKNMKAQFNLEKLLR